MRLCLKILTGFVCVLLLLGCSKKEPPLFQLIQFVQEEKYDEAIALGEKLTAENPDNTQAHRFILKSALAKNDAENYRKKYEELIQADPGVAGYHFGLGYIYTQMEQMDAALEEYQKAIELNPDIEYVHYMIGWIYSNPTYPGADIEKALAEWEKEEQLNPRSLGALQVYANRADFYLRMGDPDGAIKDYEKVAMYGFARDDIKDARELITRIRALRDELARLEAAVRNEPEDVNNLFELGKMQYKNSMFENAIETWTKAVELDPENAELRNYLGKVLLEYDRHEEAAKQLRKAIELDSTLTMPYYNLAVAEELLGRTDAAIEYYTKYIELNPMTSKLELVKQRIAELEEKTEAKQEG